MQRATAYAPGRVELLGNHTDYNEGVVLGAAIDRGITVSGSSRPDETIELRSETMGELQCRVSRLRPQQGHARWANYALAVASELISRGIPLGGFTAEISSDVPAGNGLSSSAAFEVATALFLLELHRGSLSPLEIAKVCQRAENHFVGVQSGLLDQVCSIFGQADHAVYFDARTEEVRAVAFPKNLSLIIAQSGAPRDLAAGKYNERRGETRAAAEALGVRALRDATAEQLAAASLPPLLRRRAAHIVGENERVWTALQLLERGDGEGFGKLMNASHESSRRNFENSSAELDALVAAACALPGVLGARLTGGGFGGATVTLCETKRASLVADALRTRSPDVFICRIAAGARILYHGQ